MTSQHFPPAGRRGQRAPIITTPYHCTDRHINPHHRDFQFSTFQFLVFRSSFCAFEIWSSPSPSSKSSVHEARKEDTEMEKRGDDKCLRRRNGARQVRTAHGRTYPRFTVSPRRSHRHFVRVGCFLSVRRCQTEKGDGCGPRAGSSSADM